MTCIDVLDAILNTLARFVNVNTLLIIVVAIIVLYGNKKPTKVLLSPSERRSQYVHVVKMLSDDEIKVLDVIIDKQGEVLQSEITRLTRMPRWRTSRILNRFERSGWIVRRPYGMTNIIEMNIEFE